MKQKRLGERIAAWFLCLAMVLTAINLPGFTTEVKAAEKITTWAQLKAAMESATEPTTIVLTQDIVATAEDATIEPAATTIILDLNGYTLDRNLSEPKDNGQVFFMHYEETNLTIKDSSPAKTGAITGAYTGTDGYGGCIGLNQGTLNLLGGTITGNKTWNYGGGIRKLPAATLVIGGTARVIGNYAYEMGITEENSDIHFNDNHLNGFSLATGADALVTEGEHKAQIGIRFWTGSGVPEALWQLPSAEVGECFVSNNRREQYMSQAKLVNGNWTLCLVFHDHEFDGEICTSKCELCGLIREDGIHNMTGDGCTRECSWCHISFHSDDTYDSHGVCTQCNAYRVNGETMLDDQGVKYKLRFDSQGNSVAEVCGYADNINESIVIPKTIATSNGVFSVGGLGAGCFSGCTSLKNVDIQAEVSKITIAFTECTSLVSVKLPEGLTAIQGTFRECRNLTSVVIPNSVTEIGSLTFSGCSSLTSINLPEGLKTIGIFTFEDCSKLTSINLPDGLTTIGSEAFKNCSSLASINLPEGVTKIEDSTFEGCSSLASINLPDGLTTIGKSAFRGCHSLTKATIPASVETVGKNVFTACSAENLVLDIACTPTLREVSNWGAYKTINWIHDYEGQPYVPDADGINHHQKCKNCDATSASGNHDFSKCVSNGNGTHKVVCKDCDAVQLGHESDACSGGTASCTSVPTCSKCGSSYGTSSGHSYGSDWKTDGTKHWKECSVCHEKKDSASHSGGTATCKEKAKCSVCGKEYGDLAAHKYDTKWSSDETNHWHACTVCGDKKDSAAHTLETTTTNATLTANGKKETKCTECGKVTKTETIYAAKTINLSVTKYTYDGKVKKPSVTIKDSQGNAIASTNYTVTYATGRKNVGKYTVKVTFKGNYSGSKNLTFTINPPKTSISKLTAGKKAFTAKWAKKTTQVTGYEIQYSTSKTFASGNKTVKVTSAKTVSKTIKSLKAKKTYYVRIRTYKTVNKVNYYSDWSAKKSVTTKK